MTLELRRTCRCGHLRAQHDAPNGVGARAARQAPCRSCPCDRYAGGLVVVLAVRAKEPVARVVVPDEVPTTPGPHVRRAHSAGTGGTDRPDRLAALPAASLLVTPRTPQPLPERQRERA